MSIVASSARRCVPRAVASLRMWAVAGSLVATMCGAAQGTEVCPADMRGKFNIGLYHFQYQSWSWQSKEPQHSSPGSEAYLYCHCVRNESQTSALFVNWEGTGLRMFLAPAAAGYAYFSYAESNELSRQVPLWYGAKPDKVEVVTVFNTPAVAPVVPGKGDQPRQGGAKGSAMTLRSVSSASVPNLQAVAGYAKTEVRKLDLQQIVSVAEKQPKVLVSMQMEFESAPAVDEKTGEWQAIDNECKYRVERSRLGSQLPLRLKMKLTDKDLHESVFGSPDAVEIRSDWGDAAKRFAGELKVPAGNAHQIERAVAELQILDADERIVLSSLPVTHYRVIARKEAKAGK